MSKIGFLGLGIGTSLAVVLVLPTFNAQAMAEPQVLAQTESTETVETCVALQEVTTGQTEIRKRIENRALTRGNWNTDFLVPSAQEFSYFVAIIAPENTANYEFTANLRFETGGSEMAFSGRSDVQAGDVYSIPFQSPTGRQPAVVNARVGGVNGNAYTISIVACE